MSLSSGVSDVVVRIASEFKSVRTAIAAKYGPTNLQPSQIHIGTTAPPSATNSAGQPYIWVDTT